MANGELQLHGKKLASTLSTPAQESIGTYYLAENPQFYEPQRGNTFKFYVSGLEGILGTMFNSSTDGTDEGNVLSLAVKASSVPQFTIDPISITRGNNQMHFAGKAKFDSGSLVVHDYIGANTKEILLAWQRLAYNVETEKVGLAKDYKKDAYLLEYTPDFQLVRTWRLFGCWVSKVGEGNYDHESADARTMDVTIYYDKAYIDTSDRV